jgi:hypothetical protein
MAVMFTADRTSLSHQIHTEMELYEVDKVREVFQPAT